MQDGSSNSDTAQGCDVDRFARLMLHWTAQASAKPGKFLQRAPLETYVHQMHAAVLTSDRAALDSLVATMQAAKISEAAIAEVYVPEVARRLGQDWVDDVLEFSAVTMGCARLQGLIRRLGPQWDHAPNSLMAEGPVYLVTTPEHSQHTLGAIVLAGQLRWRGHAAQIVLGPDSNTLANKLREGHYAGILISLADEEAVEQLHAMLPVIKRHAPQTPILAGGHIQNIAGDLAQHPDIDLVTSRLEDALRFCDYNGLAGAGRPPLNMHTVT